MLEAISPQYSSGFTSDLCNSSWYFGLSYWEEAGLLEEDKDEEEKEEEEEERQHEESMRLPSPGANHIFALCNIFCVNKLR